MNVSMRELDKLMILMASKAPGQFISSGIPSIKECTSNPIKSSDSFPDDASASNLPNSLQHLSLGIISSLNKAGYSPKLKASDKS